jgi:hypothetical protein
MTCKEVKSKAKIFPVFFNWAPRYEGVLGSGSIAPRILWPWHYVEVSHQLHAPAALPPGKSPLYPLDRRLGGPQSRSEHGGEAKNSQPLPRFEPPIIQPVAQRYTTEVSIGLILSANNIMWVIVTWFFFQLVFISLLRVSVSFLMYSLSVLFIARRSSFFYAHYYCYYYYHHHHHHHHHAVFLIVIYVYDDNYSYFNILCYYFYHHYHYLYNH